MIKNIFYIFLLSVLYTTANAQVRYSISADLNAVRSFKKEQRFTSIGQTITGVFHFTAKTSGYASIGYVAKGTFNNELTATAIQPATIPAAIPYQNKASLSLRHISLGLRQYLKGNGLNENGWNLYSISGLGIMMGRVTNTHSILLDTTKYQLPVLAGEGKFKRLTLDLGLGYEWSFIGGLSLYTEAKILCPVSDYPSRYLLINDDAPLVGTFGIGLRLLFD